MKYLNKIRYLLILGLMVLGSCASRKISDTEKITIRTSPEHPAMQMEIEFVKGEAFNHPSFAFWTEDLTGQYIETLYVTRYVATGRYGHGEIEPGKWKREPGEARRPATLPYWAHKRNIKAPDGLYVPSPETAVPDALTSATPLEDFTLETATRYNGEEKFRILMEINQAWDSNQYWDNNKFPGNKDYYGSLQPALVYAVTVDPREKETAYHLNPIGYSHPTGENGKLFTDLTTLTTAKDIVYQVVVRLK